MACKELSNLCDGVRAVCIHKTLTPFFCNNNETHQYPHARSHSIILSDELASSTLYVLIAFTRIPDRKNKSYMGRREAY